MTWLFLTRRRQASFIDESIYSETGIKAGYVKENVDKVLKAVELLIGRGAELVILACTELPLVAEYFPDKIKAKLIDPTDVLAKRIVSKSKGHR